LDTESVQRVRQVLIAAGAGDKVRQLAETARSARDAASALDCELGAIVKSLIFVVGDAPVLALVAGDRLCDEAALGRILNLPGGVRRGNADMVRKVTGFAIGGVAPVGLANRLPCTIDVSLKRFETIWAAAGHPHCVFPTTVDELKWLTGGIVSYALGKQG
jgi:prolyl-tRNA editing enzyme YbaK/EbsC (Cys-tRNA(Pro) deacylase)